SNALRLINFMDCEVFIIAGDIVAKGNVHAASHVFSLIREVYNGEIIAVFGNEDYEELSDKFRELYPDVIWLDDDYIDIDLSVGKVRIIGSRGVLDMPTSWQMKHIPDIVERYNKRIKILEKLLSSSKYPTLLVTHYAPTYATLKGEPSRIWPQLGSRKLESIIKRYKPLAVIHGHAHNGRIDHIEIDGIPIYNVSLPAFKRLFKISLKKQDTLMKYF
ncbi:MAG: metallophosphoesterase, partial [Thermoprotei archaeon]|nr:metallophosphoesterase [Thermoprotei archaeon]